MSLLSLDELTLEQLDTLTIQQLDELELEESVEGYGKLVIIPRSTATLIISPRSLSKLTLGN